MVLTLPTPLPLRVGAMTMQMLGAVVAQVVRAPFPSVQPPT